MKRKLLFLFVVAVLISNYIPTCSKAQDRDQDVQVTATVIGRFRAGGVVVFPGSIEIPEYILVRIIVPGGNLKKGEYIQIRRDSSKYPVELPEEMFKQMASWKFTLKASIDEERNMQDVISSERKEKIRSVSVESPFDRVPGAEREELPIEVIVPLYDVVAKITPGAP